MVGDIYIGETGRSMNPGIKEHKAACRLGNFEVSSLVDGAAVKYALEYWINIISSRTVLLCLVDGATE